ncbi:MAG: GNAT family N-acetyltransferase [Flavobacteriales bacterium]|nr:GNAT family N-acetyltransferase [Flavobacteriales bacterium]|tara:strand:- start:1984 stop:2433 length:450 start_codon:yes stop_codon:yes gene_type:complete
MINWSHKKYEDLSRDELYKILRLRQEVFIIEQKCNYLDADNHDIISTHLIAYQDDKIIAYMRVVPAGTIYSNISFGRILVKKEYRNLGLGKELLKRGLDLFSPDTILVMSAQVYLVKFYEYFGFNIIGEEYLEDEILHIKMIRNGKNSS